jgi:hypothetical protein
MVITGPDDVDRYLSEREDGLYLSRLGLPDPATGNRTMVRLDPPMPYVKNVKMDDAWVYQGTLSMFSSLSPREVKLSVIVYAQVDAVGELLSPTLRYDVLRERRDIEISLAPGGAAVNPSDLGLPPCLTEGISYAFIGSASPMPIALIQVDAMNQAKQVEFISHPWAGTVIQQMPRRPDVFVYPNPSFGNVRFDFLNLPTGYYDLEIYNILGSKIRTERIYINGVKTLPLDLSRFKKGTYIYRLVDDQKNTIRSKRLVIITA